ncbi:MAG TPA: hypothetical protein VII49_08265 [Rhizomicrobium sp.]
MPSPLKVFRAHFGFYDCVVAAPSQKAALAAWGAAPSEFAKGFAIVTNDPDAVAAALAEPGMVLKRPAGCAAAFKADPGVPPVPKANAGQKAAAQQVKRERQRKAKFEAQRLREAQKREAEAAKRELAEIEREEHRLRARRQALRKKFEPHRV